MEVCMKKRLLSTLILLSLCNLVFPLPIKADSGASYIQKVSFFGDSTTYGLIHYIINNDGKHGTPVVKLKRDQVLVPPDGTFYLRNIPTAQMRYHGKDYALAEGIHLASPEILIITVGVNGLPAWTEESFLVYYNRLIDLIHTQSPNTKIVLQSIYPVARERDKKLASFTIDKVDEINGWIEKLAKQRSLPYLNTASALKGKDGWLIPSYHNGDGMHLNTAGFNAALKYIMDHPIQKG
jgi:hypothetical protein